MKKSLFFVPMLAVAVMATSCIDNEESEGVKEIRLAQASLLQAQASATTTNAQAQATLMAAEAAYKQAQADLQTAQIAYTEAQVEAQEEAIRHQAAMNALQEEMQAAGNELQKANIQRQMEQAEAQHLVNMANIEAQAQQSAVNAERQLLLAQQQLDAAQKNYEEQMAASEAAHQLAMDQIANQAKSDEMNYLMNGYENAWYDWNDMSQMINGIKHEILYNQNQLANRQESDADANGLLTLADNDVKAKTKAVTNAENDLAKANAALADVNAVESIIVDYKAELVILNADLAAKTLEEGVKFDLMVKAYDAYWAADEAYDAASAEYSRIDSKRYTAENDTVDAYNDYMDAKTDYDNQMAVVTAAGDDVTVAQKAWLEELKTELDRTKAIYDEKVAAYPTIFDQWKAAYLAMNDANAVRETALHASWNAQNEYNTVGGQISQINNRISDVNWFISSLTASNGGDDALNVKAKEAALKAAQNALKAAQANYDNVVAGIAADLPANEIVYEYYTNTIAALQEGLAAAETALELYKAELDDWSAKLQAALDEEN